MRHPIQLGLAVAKARTLGDWTATGMPSHSHLWHFFLCSYISVWTSDNMGYLTRQTVALRALGRYTDWRSCRIGGSLCTVVAHRRVDESSDVRDVGSVRGWLSLIFTGLITEIRAMFRTHEKMEFGVSITLIEMVSTVALWRFSSNRKGMVD